jgi:hypothetical protein
MLGRAYEYLIKQFVDVAGKKGGEFYTSPKVFELIVKLSKPQEGIRICDPTAGSGERFAQSIDLIMPRSLANPYRDDLKFLGRVRLGAKQRYREHKMDITDCGAKVKQLIEEHVRADAIQILHDPVDIFSSRFSTYVDSLSSDDAKASEMEHAIRHWTVKEDVQREMRSRIKRQLRAAKCPANKLEAVTQQVMNLAKVHFRA